MAIIQDMERRLLNWARWKAGEQAGGLGFAAVNLMSTGGRDGYFEAVVPTSGPEAAETDRGVIALPSELRAAVEAWYLQGGTVARRAERMCIHIETFKLRRSRAHVHLQRWLAARATEARARA